METLLADDADLLKELRGLVLRIKRGDCVLVLGPRVAIRADDADRRPLDELLAEELLAAIREEGSEGSPTVSLRRAADLHYRKRHDREELELAVQDFYAGEGTTTPFHCDLAQLPFRLCICASPDSLMLNAFEAAGKSPQRGYYSFKKAANARLSLPTPEKPLVYHLFGHHEDLKSLVLTEGDLIEFLVAIVRGSPPLPDVVRCILADPDASFLFLGFGFHNWYLRVLLQVMNVYGHVSKAVAFEDTQFFDHPEREQAVGFFSEERLIEFLPLRWEAFARSLREAYGAGLRKAAESGPIHPAIQANPPIAFVSYASEDGAAVEALAEELETRGIKVWRDKKKLRAGDNWSDVLHDVIARRVDYLIVVQTHALTTRTEGVFHQEIATAQKRQAGMGELDGQKLRFLIPVKIGAANQLSSLAAERHVTDIGEPGGVDSLVESIAEDWQRRAELASRRQAVA